MAKRAQRFDHRQSMQNKCFEIFHYQEKEVQNIHVHHHDFYEVYFFLDGDVRFTVEGKSYTLEHGDLLLISPMELHQAQIQKGHTYERIILWIDCDYLQKLGGEATDLARCFDRHTPQSINYVKPSKAQQAILLDLLEKMNSEFYGENFGNSTYANALLMQLMVEINRLVYAVLPVQKNKDTDFIIQVLNYIGEHFTESITLEGLADRFFVSKYYLSHEFRLRVGTSVYRYIIFRRLMQAKELLSAGNAAGDVCSACGFGDYANFYRAFKAEYGMTPKQFSANKK